MRGSVFFYLAWLVDKIVTQSYGFELPLHSWEEPEVTFGYSQFVPTYQDLLWQLLWSSDKLSKKSLWQITCQGGYQVTPYISSKKGSRDNVGHIKASIVLKYRHLCNDGPNLLAASLIGC